MREQIEVVYENGVLRPLEPLPGPLQEHQRLTVILEGLPDTVAADPTVSLEVVRQALAKVSGTLAQVVSAEREER